MKIRVRAGDASSVPAELTVVPIARDELDARRIRRALGGKAAPSVARELAATGGFRGREGDLLGFPIGGGERGMALLVGVGDRRDIDLDSWRRAAGRARRYATEHGIRHVAFVCDDGTETGLVAVVEGFRLAGYRFEKYKSHPNGLPRVDELTLLTSDAPPERRALERAWRTADIVLDAVALVRDLVNEPAAVKTPTYLAAEAERVASESGLGIEVWDPARIQKEGLHGLIAVARGSAEEPRFLRLRYEPENATKRVALVGKGITFDSGGLSLKQPKPMETMKCDMAGGATVLAVMAAIARLRPAIAVDGYVPLSENLPSGAAQKPGDVIRYRNGKTVEVLNTDAEGRLVLADALTVAAATKPDAIIDIATLTGACIIALGTEVAGVFANNQRLVDDLLAAAREQGEGLWQLPLVPEYREDLKSAVADLKNIGGGNAGSITGALFLQEFVDGTPWAHMDIAGPAFTDKDCPYAPRGGTGFGVRMLIQYLLKTAASSDSAHTDQTKADTSGPERGRTKIGASGPSRDEQSVARPGREIKAARGRAVDADAAAARPAKGSSARTARRLRRRP